MKFIPLVCSIAYFIQFPAQALQKQAFRSRSISHPHLTLQKQENFTEEPIQENGQQTHQELEADMKQVWEQIIYLESLGVEADDATASAQPESLLQRINLRRNGVPLAALTISTIGLTAQHLKDSQIKFEPFSIIASLGALKSVAIGTICLTFIYLIQKQWTDLTAGKYEERIKRIRLESEYRATAQEMKKQFEKLTENVTTNNKANHDIIKALRAELLKEIAENKNKLETRLRKYTEDNEAQLSKWKADHEVFNKTFEEFIHLLETTEKVDRETMTDSIRRLKKIVKAISGIPDKLIKKADCERMAQEVVIVSQQFDTILASKQHLNNTAQQITPPPVSRTKLERLKDFFKHKRSASLSPGNLQTSPITIDVSSSSLAVPVMSLSLHSEGEKKEIS